MISNDTLQKLQLWAGNSREEICGIIDTEGNLYTIRNTAPRPQYSFIFERAGYFKAIQTIKDKGLKILCIWHTHPTGDPTPSKADLEYIKRSKNNSLIVTAKSFKWIPYE